MVTAISTGADAAGAAAGADASPPAPLPLSAAGSSGRLCMVDVPEVAGGARVVIAHLAQRSVSVTLPFICNKNPNSGTHCNAEQLEQLCAQLVRNSVQHYADEDVASEHCNF